MRLHNRCAKGPPFGRIGSRAAYSRRILATTRQFPGLKCGLAGLHGAMQIMIARSAHLERSLNLKLRLESSEVLLRDGNRLSPGRWMIDLDTDQKQPTGAGDSLDFVDGF